MSKTVGNDLVSKLHHQQVQFSPRATSPSRELVRICVARVKAVRRSQNMETGQPSRPNVASGDQRAKWEKELQLANKEYFDDARFQDLPDLTGKLERLKCAFMKHDSALNGYIDYDTLRLIVEDFDLSYTTSELKVLVKDITGNSRPMIPYKDYAMTMLGRRSTMCQRIMTFNQSGGGEPVTTPCLLDSPAFTCSGRMVFSPFTGITSPMSMFPPPPPPSPAEAGPVSERYPAA